MDYKSILGAAAACVALIQYGLYIRSILSGKTKPHVFSWFVWGVPCGFVFLAQLLKGGGAGSWTTGATALLCTLIFFLSLSHGEKTITRSDWVALVTSLAALALWAMTQDPLGSVILITMADVVGMIPTLRKSYMKPHEEMASSYVIADLKWLLSILALQNYSLTTCLYPAAMFVSIVVLVVFLAYRRHTLAGTHETRSAKF